MRCCEVQIWSNGHDTMGIDTGVAPLIVVLNVCQVGGLSKAWSLVEVSHIWPEVGIVYQPLLITLDKETQ
jgi:hypothetical protein